MSVLVKIVQLRGKAHSLHLLQCITSIQSFNPDLTDLDCGHSLDDRALQTLIQTLSCWFSVLGFSHPGSPKHPAVLQKPPHQCYGKYRWFWEPNCHKGFLCFRIPPHSWICSPLCQPFAQQRRSKMMVGHLDSCCLCPGGSSSGLLPDLYTFTS